jgi:Family of unknown function (DUF5715)
MRRSRLYSILFFVIGFCFCLFLTSTVRFLNQLKWNFNSEVKQEVVFYPIGKCPDCKKIANKYWKIGPLNDNNTLHLECAKRLGIVPFESNADFEAQISSLGLSGKLEQIVDAETYKVKKLTHSYPYLVPGAIDLLDEIGSRFEAKLSQIGIGPYFMMISSVLRTNESQNGLGRRNSNATTISAHIYGTTFDISYKEFLPSHGIPAQEGFCRHDMMRHVLAEVLTEMCAEGRCKVVREKRQACFHITVAQ